MWRMRAGRSVTELVEQGQLELAQGESVLFHTVIRPRSGSGLT